MNYTYWAFGLKISSEIEFPELLPIEFNNSADVRFKIGVTPDSISGNTHSSPFATYTINENEFLFRVEGVARYYTSMGNEIIIEPDKPVEDWRGVRLYVLASVITTVLQIKKRLPLHASALLHKNSLILITGYSGAGKSTSVAGLMKRGYSIFSDDVITLRQKGDEVIANASYPMIKLWDDTITKMDHVMFNDRSFRVRNDLEKFGLFFHESFNTGEYSSSKFLILKKGEVNQFSVEKLSATEAFKEVYNQIYRPMLMVGKEQITNAFSVITSLTNRCEVFVITRPEECDPERLLDIEETLISK